MKKKFTLEKIARFNFDDILKNEKCMMVGTVLATILIILTMYLVFINSSSQAIDKMKFSSIMKTEKLKIYDVSDQFGESYVESATIAYNEKTNYQIEFIVFKDADSAKNAFTLNKNTFEKIKTDKDAVISTSNDKISKYALTTDDKYMYVSRRQNTLIFLDVDGSYKVEVANLVTKLGY